MLVKTITENSQALKREVVVAASWWLASSQVVNHIIITTKGAAGDRCWSLKTIFFFFSLSFLYMWQYTELIVTLLYFRGIVSMLPLLYFYMLVLRPLTRVHITFQYAKVT